MRQEKKSDGSEIFSCIMATGFWWSDKSREEHGDYAKLAFLPFSNLELEFFSACTPSQKEIILKSAKKYQDLRGEKYQISTAGQMVTLGYALEGVS